jgi:hypothetical protein
MPSPFRDSLLAFGGRLDLAMGGPSVKQFNMSPGVHVTPKVDYASFEVDASANRRRSIYRFRFRTLPDPLMDTLDCPAGDQLAPVRTESVTALQACTLLNNPFVVRQCEHIAARIEAEHATTPARIDFAFRLILNRPPRADEAADFIRYADQSGTANAVRVLINSNEFLFVE